MVYIIFVYHENILFLIYCAFKHLFNTKIQYFKKFAPPYNHSCKLSNSTIFYIAFHSCAIKKFAGNITLKLINFVNLTQKSVKMDEDKLKRSFEDKLINKINI